MSCLGFLFAVCARVSHETVQGRHFHAVVLTSHLPSREIKESSIFLAAKNGLCSLLFPDEPEHEDCRQDKDIQADMDGDLHFDGCNVYGCA